ncbi:hypothetical protein D3C76_1837040 [compost metagenome]
MGESGLDQKEIGEHIGLKGVIQLFFCNINNAWLHILHAMVVDQNIDLSIGLHRRANDGFTIFLQAEVNLD